MVQDARLLHRSVRLQFAVRAQVDLVEGELDVAVVPQQPHGQRQRARQDRVDLGLHALAVFHEQHRLGRRDVLAAAGVAEYRARRAGAGRDLGVVDRLQRLVLAAERLVAPAHEVELDGVESHQRVVRLQPVDRRLDLGHHLRPVLVQHFRVGGDLRRHTLGELGALDNRRQAWVQRALDDPAHVVLELRVGHGRLDRGLHRALRVRLKQVLVERLVEKSREVEVDVLAADHLNRLAVLRLAVVDELDLGGADRLQALRQARLVEHQVESAGALDPQLAHQRLSQRVDGTDAGEAVRVAGQVVEPCEQDLQRAGGVHVRRGVLVAGDGPVALRHHHAGVRIDRRAHVGRGTRQLADRFLGRAQLAVRQQVGCGDAPVALAQALLAGCRGAPQVRRHRQAAAGLRWDLRLWERRRLPGAALGRTDRDLAARGLGGQDGGQGGVAGLGFTHARPILGSFPQKGNPLPVKPCAAWAPSP